MPREHTFHSTWSNSKQQRAMDGGHHSGASNAESGRVDFAEYANILFKPYSTTHEARHLRWTLVRELESQYNSCHLGEFKKIAVKANNDLCERSPIGA